MRVRSLLFSAVLLHNNCSLAVRLEDAAHNSNVVVGVGDHECQNQNDSDSAIATNKHSQNEEDAEQAETTDDNDNTTSNDQDEYDYQFLTSNHDVVSTEVPGLKICFKDDVLCQPLPLGHKVLISANDGDVVEVKDVHNKVYKRLKMGPEVDQHEEQEVVLTRAYLDDVRRSNRVYRS